MKILDQFLVKNKKVSEISTVFHQRKGNLPFFLRRGKFHKKCTTFVPITCHDLCHNLYFVFWKFLWILWSMLFKLNHAFLVIGWWTLFNHYFMWMQASLLVWIVYAITYFTIFMLFLLFINNAIVMLDLIPMSLGIFY